MEYISVVHDIVQRDYNTGINLLGATQSYKSLANSNSISCYIGLFF